MNQLTDKQKLEAEEDFKLKLQRIEDNKSWIVVAKDIQTSMIKHGSYQAKSRIYSNYIY